jgi:dipeptidyl aminopeptidase/acylaminoacyl peptidase
VDQYVRIDLETGALRALIDAPSDFGWFSQGAPSWSGDGKAILLPGTFLSSERPAPSLPCVAVVDVVSNNVTCVVRLKRASTAGSPVFVSGDRHRVKVSFWGKDDWGTKEYQQNSAGEWQLAEQISKPSEVAVGPGFELAVKQSFNEPPRLVAIHKQNSKVVLDPNPQLKNLEMGAAEVYTWRDHAGGAWRGGLYKPSRYEPGKRYPLVIQTHGFYERFYRPSGGFRTGFAARALAAEGIMVLQVDDDGHGCPMNTPGEAPCAASGYEAATKELVSKGLVDPERIGITGFSHTCYWVMETLRRNPLRVKAATITDGVMFDYNQYLMSAGLSEMTDYADMMIGARPIGSGLQTWLQRSPGFNL